MIKKVIGVEGNNIGPFRFIRMFGNGRVLLDAFQKLKLIIDASPATISSISGFQYDRDNLFSRIEEAENRMSLSRSGIFLCFTGKYPGATRNFRKCSAFNSICKSV